VKNEYAYAKRHEFRDGDGIPETCPPEIRARIIERRARRTKAAVTPAPARKAAKIAVAPVFKPGRLLTPTL
jgi:hypothetical protein